MAKIWLNKIDEVYSGDEPWFYEPSNFKWLPAFIEYYHSIEPEVGALFGPQSDRYLDYFQDEIQFPPSSWSTISLLSYGMENQSNVEAFSQLTEHIYKIPGIVTAYFSRLKPNSHILPHCGPINATLRIHLGLIVPSISPEECGIKVGNEIRNWKVGEALAFLDAHQHEAWNRTDEDRVVLILDVVRPEFMGRKRLICCIMIFSYALYKMLTVLGVKQAADYLKGKKTTTVLQWIGGITLYPFS